MSNLSDDVSTGSIMAAGPLHRLRHALAVEWLQQVIHRIHFERPHCILIKRRRKNDLGQRQLLVEQFLDHAKAVQSRHLHVKENEVRIMLADQADRFQSILALRHHVHLADVLQQIRELIPRQLLVVNNDSR